MARVIVTQNPENARCLLARIPGLDRRIVHVSKAFCWLGNEAFDLRGAVGFGREHFLFFLPAGVRPVKGNLECLLALEKVHEVRPHVRFVAAGPALDPEYAGAFAREIKRLLSFARWIEGISPACMRSAYADSDIVLNASFSEGLSNALLEAIASERPMLAADIPGNRLPVLGGNENEASGCLYNPEDPDDMVRKAIMLVDDAGLRARFTRAIRSRKSGWISPSDEASGLVSAYRSALSIQEN